MTDPAIAASAPAAATMSAVSAGTTSLPSPQFSDGKFHNAVPIRKQSFGEQVDIFWKFLFQKPKNTVPTGVIPVLTLTRAQLLAASDDSVFRLGHSTTLFKLGGAFYLTDPVFSERASPVQWSGPARFHRPPISIADLPPIEAIILSHDHFDHLDYAAMLALAAKTSHFIAPLGVGDRLIGWGVPAAKVRQLDWWQSTQVKGVSWWRRRPSIFPAGPSAIATPPCGPRG